MARGANGEILCLNRPYRREEWNSSSKLNLLSMNVYFQLCFAYGTKVRHILEFLHFHHICLMVDE